MISKQSGGLGGDISRIRHSEIGTVGTSAGIIPMLRLYNEMVRYCDQGGKRKGAITIYLRPHHIDIFEFIDVVKKTGDQYSRAHDINTAIWFPWLFWKRVVTDEKWTLFCPAKTPLLNDVWGSEFEKQYEEYEILSEQKEKQYLDLKKKLDNTSTSEPSYVYLKESYFQAKRDRIIFKTVRARELLDEVIKTQRKAGMPYVMHGDACNMKSNQKNLGMIRSSNLCVSPDTLILTRSGYVTISEVVDKEVDVWNGSQYSTVTVKNTGRVDKLLNVRLTNGLSLKCTLEHKFLMAAGPTGNNYDPKKAQRCQARFLQKGDRLSNFLIPNGFQDPHNVNTDVKQCLTSVQDLFVESVDVVEGETETYCFTEPINNAGVFNGILTGQCLEIIEHTSKDEIASCLTGDTLIQTKNGLKRLDQSDGEEIFVPYISDEDIGLEPGYVKSKLIEQGYKPVYKIELACGMTLRATDEHKFLTQNAFGDFKWKEVRELERHERLVLRYDPKNVVLDFNFSEGMNLHDEHDLIDSLQKSTSSNQQSALLLGFVYKHSKYANHTFSLQVNNPTEIYPYFLNLGVVPLVHHHPDRLVFHGLSAKRIANHLQLPFEEDVEEVENNEFTSQLVYEPELVSEEKVYDLYVPDRHHFIASGVVSHNCNLASISLKKFAKGYLDHTKPFMEEVKQKVDFQKLGEVTASLVRNLNKVIDHNYYPLDEHGDGFYKEGKISKTNKKHRPLGIGVSGLAELIYGLDLLPTSEETRWVNKCVFACMYFHSLVESVKQSLIHGPYDSFSGSPASEGKLQFDLWKEEFQIKGPNALRKAEDDEPVEPSVWGQTEIRLANGDVIEASWDSLKKAIVKNGCRNSLHIALMPTAGTSAVIAQGATETTEFPMANLYSRKLMNGAYPIINYFMVNDLRQLNLWDENTAQYLSANDGSLKGFTKYSQTKSSLSAEVINRLTYLEKKYATMWEIKQSWLLKLAAERGRYVDQSQSTNIYLADATDDVLKAVHLQTDMLGLKTGMYYLRSKSSCDPIKFTTDPEIMNFVNNSLVEKTSEPAACNKNDPQCLSCQ